MAIELRRCLYIGLGGTGMSALLHTKKMFAETYDGDVPPMIGFLGIDTDGGAYTKSLDSKYGPISLGENEKCSIVSSEAKDIYLRQKEKFSWMPKENENAIVAMHIGAGQVRTNGRLAFVIRQPQVEVALASVLNRIQDAEISTNKDYKLLANNVEIHIIFSLCGGTGAGTFIDLAYLIRHIAPNCKLTGYAVLPDVFEAMIPAGPAMQRVKPNAYGSIVDLDWLMHLTPSSNPLTFAYTNKTIQVNERPFNAVMLIDNKNENNDVYTRNSQLSEMISLSLVISAGKLSVAAASVSDNIEKFYAEGMMDIEDKKAWVASMGACEIIFKGQDLAKIYAYKASQRIIQILMNACQDIDSIVNTWIDSPEVRIRENNGRDDVIDAILPLAPKISLVDINDTTNPTQEIEFYKNSIRPKDQDLNTTVEDLLANVKHQLKKLIQKHINEECGISTAEDIIINIQKQINLFKGEMEEEYELFKDKLPAIKQVVEIANNDLIELEKKTFVFNKSSKKQGCIEEIVNAVMQEVLTEREIIRRREALRFYNALNIYLLDELTHITNIKKSLINVNSQLTKLLIDTQNKVGKVSKTFQIDLAEDVAKKVMVDDKELNLTDFFASLNLDKKLYNLTELSTQEVMKKFLSYSLGLPSAIKWHTTTVDNIIDSYSEEKYQHLMQMAYNKSMPLLQKNYQGYTPAQLYEGFYVGVPDNAKSRLIEKNSFSSMLPTNTPVDYVSTGMNDRIIFYRQMGVIPAYAIASLGSYKERYDNTRTNSHFDANIRLRMDRENYSILPQTQEDDTLELWVYGLIFGLIKNENGYFYKSLEQGKALSDYWVSLSTQYRDEAFEQFRNNKSAIRKEFTKYIEDQEKTRGLDSIKELKVTVQQSYLNDYSQVLMSKEELLQRENSKIANLIEREIDFVTKHM